MWTSLLSFGGLSGLPRAGGCRSSPASESTAGSSGAQQAHSSPVPGATSPGRAQGASGPLANRNPARDIPLQHSAVSADTLGCRTGGGRWRPAVLAHRTVSRGEEPPAPRTPAPRTARRLRALLCTHPEESEQPLVSRTRTMP